MGSLYEVSLGQPVQIYTADCVLNGKGGRGQYGRGYEPKGKTRSGVRLKM